MILSIFILIVGFILLVKGADFLVSGASSLAKRYNISDLAIGLTIVAFGTSAPELVVNVFASAGDNQGIVYGNIIGSNIFNLFAILGISGLIAPLVVASSTVRKEIPLSFVAAALLLFLVNDETIWGFDNILNRWDGLILIIFFAGFLFYVYKQLKRDPSAQETGQRIFSPLSTWMRIIGGLTFLVVGGRLIVDNAVNIATFLGIEEKIIGLTIVAIGTSLPELATSVVATIRKNNDIAVGNIIGSNIFNIFLILSVSAFVKPIPFDLQLNKDLFVLLGGTIFLFIAMFTGKKHKLDRWEACILLGAFVIYTYFLVQGAMNQ